ncbi:tetratricopeptide repeat domain 39B [Camelus ferus]|nr:tetratricopeptide repeat domain 39B [Camelus ferus]
MYHALGYSTIVVLQAVMTFEQQDIQNGISAMKDALQTCQKNCYHPYRQHGSFQRFRKKRSDFNIMAVQAAVMSDGYSEVFLVANPNLFGLFETMMITLKCKSSCQEPSQLLGGRECLSILHVIQKNKVEQQFFSEFEGGVKLGIGAFNLGSLMLFYHGRIELLKGNVEEATYVFLKAAILSMLPEKDVAAAKEDVVALFRLPSWKYKPVITGRPDASDYSVDDECLVKLLKGCCLKNLQRPLQAELCFNHVIQSEKLLKYDHYLVPFTLFELAFLYKNQGEIDKAIKVLETAR